MDTQLYGVAIVPSIVGLITVAKQTGLPTRFAPAASLIFGIAAGIALQLNTASQNWFAAVVLGIGLGLSATGLYSGSTTVAATYGGKQAAPEQSAQKSSVVAS